MTAAIITQKHGIQVMDMDDDGNISFIVYGYMNRGEHEGENGISVYRFSADDRAIEELAIYSDGDTI